MSDQALTQEDIESGKDCPVLGPSYFAGRRVAERVMENLKDEMFKPLLDEFSKKFCDVLWDAVRDSLLSDTELNIQGHIYRQVDDCVRYLLSGERWAIERYALGERYDCDQVRAAIARHVPKELQDKRIAELEAELERVTKDRDRYRNL